MDYSHDGRMMPYDQGKEADFNSCSFACPPDLTTSSTFGCAMNSESPNQWYYAGQQQRVQMIDSTAPKTDVGPNNQDKEASFNACSFVSSHPNLTTLSTFGRAMNNKGSNQWYHAGQQRVVLMNDLTAPKTDVLPINQGEEATFNSCGSVSRYPDVTTLSTFIWALNEESPDQWYREVQTIMPMNNWTSEKTDIVAKDQAQEAEFNSSSFSSRPLESNTSSTFRCALNEEYPNQWYRVEEQTRMPMSNLAVQTTDTMPNDQGKGARSNSFSFAPWPSDWNISLPFGYILNEEDLERNPCSLNNGTQELRQSQERQRITPYMTAVDDQECSMTHLPGFNNMIQRSEFFLEKRISDSNNATKINHNKDSIEKNALSSDRRIHERCNFATPKFSSTFDTVQIISPSLQHLPSKNVSDEQRGKAADQENRLSENNLENVPAHGTAARFICSTCNQGFQYDSSFRAHLKSHQYKLRLSCDKCPTQFTRPDTLKRHYRKFHGDAQFKCDQCAKQFSSNSKLIYHIGVAHEGERFQCGKCPNEYNRKGNLKRHYMIVHEGFRFTCEKCLRKFTCEKNLKQHSDYCHRAD